MQVRFLGLLVIICVLTFTFTGNLWKSLWLNWANVLFLSNMLNASSPIAVQLFTGLKFETKPADTSIPVNPNSLVSRLMIVAELTSKHYSTALQQANIFLSQNDSDPMILALKSDTLWFMHETLPAIEAWKRAGYYQRLVDAAQFLV
jgi:hypothetical protein